MTPTGMNRFSKQVVPEQRPHVALLTPYNGGNLGDAAIQDAMIANLTARLPDAIFSGISLNSDNFVERHGTAAFPLAGTNVPFYQMSQGTLRSRSTANDSAAARGQPSSALEGRLKRAIKRVPLLWPLLLRLRARKATLGREARHAVAGYRFLRAQQLVIVSGGGQLDEEWGGPWGHPFALFKWAILAKLAGVSYAVASVGSAKVASRAARVLFAAALRLARYRSYRDQHSREIATGLLPRAASDPIVPDLAFSLPPSALPPPAGLHALARGRRVVAISPIAFAMPGRWPTADESAHRRYLTELRRVISDLLMRDYFLVVVWSSLGDDDRIVPDLLGPLDEGSKKRLSAQMHVPDIATWKDLVSVLRDSDLLVASRLHSTILGFISETPTVAISFDPKVDRVMADLGQTDYLLQFGDFTAAEVLEALSSLEHRKAAVLERVAAYRDCILRPFAQQYDTLAALAMASR